jgi:predicted nucleic acid-binding protein
MVAVYLDASVVVPILLEESHSSAVNDWIEANEARLLLSDLAAAEVASALSLAVRTGRETRTGAERRLGEFDEWRAALTFEAEIVPDDIRIADHFVRRFELRLRTPDAIHTAMAQRLGATLITLDRRLLRAASALGVEASSPVGPDKETE